jgi:hypothetical protein
MWCLRCYEPIRQLTPRAPQLPTPEGLTPIDPGTVRAHHVWLRLEKPVYSRVRAGATTSGLWGRVLMTAVVLAFGPWGAFGAGTILYLFGYVPIAILFLHAIWRREYVGTETTAGIVHDVRTVTTLRVGSSIVGVVLVGVALSIQTFVLGFLPAIPFLIVGAFPQAAFVVSEAMQEARTSPIGTFILLNVLNIADAVLSEAAIDAGAARELNPLVLAIGFPAKVVLVAILSALLLWKRPRTLVWPTLALLVLGAYHLTGLLAVVA